MPDKIEAMLEDMAKARREREAQRDQDAELGALFRLALLTNRVLRISPFGDLSWYEGDREVDAHGYTMAERLRDFLARTKE